MGKNLTERAVEVFAGDPGGGEFCVRVRTDGRVSCAVVVARGAGFFTWVQPGADHARAFSVALDSQPGRPTCTCHHFTTFDLCGHVEVLLQLRRQGALDPKAEAHAA